MLNKYMKLNLNYLWKSEWFLPIQLICGTILPVLMTTYEDWGGKKEIYVPK